VEERLLALAFQTYLQAYRPHYSLDFKHQHIVGVLHRFSLATHFEEKKWADRAEQFHQELAQRFAYTDIMAHYPIRTHLREQLWEDNIDFVLQTPNGLVLIIDLLSMAGTLAKDKQKAQEQVSRFVLAQEAIGENIRSCWVHFPLAGQLLEVVF
jgi:hypothetical protein